MRQKSEHAESSSERIVKNIRRATCGRIKAHREARSEGQAVYQDRAVRSGSTAAPAVHRLPPAGNPAPAVGAR